MCWSAAHRLSCSCRRRLVNLLLLPPLVVVTKRQCCSGTLPGLCISLTYVRDLYPCKLWECCNTHNSQLQDICSLHPRCDALCVPPRCTFASFEIAVPLSWQPLHTMLQHCVAPCFTQRSRSCNTQLSAGSIRHASLQHSRGTGHANAHIPQHGAADAAVCFNQQP